MARLLDDDHSADSPEGVFASPADRVAALIDLGTSAAADDADAKSVGVEATPDVSGYEITGKLGEGGMGTVWRAVQLSTRRQVALKLVAHGAAIGSHRARLRFDREVELAARLEHPHIARVYDSGMSRGVYHYAMELVEGRHLDRYLREEKLDARQALSLMRDVCLAVQYAHQRGVIHRDLKPSNILVTNEGTPKVLDFGLAKALDDAGEGTTGLTLTLEGQFAGTPAFMAPEQAAGDGRRIDTRTDVYGLGATLYLLLTGGHTPHDPTGARLAVLRRIVEQDPRRPRQFDRRIGRDLEAIVLTALARDPDHRYESAGALARDLNNYLAGRPVAARRPSAPYVLRKWALRHRAAVATVVLLAAGFAAAARYEQWRTVAQRRRGLAHAEKLTVAQREAGRGKWLAAMTLFDELREDGYGWSSGDCVRGAYLHLLLGDRETHRRLCRELLARAGEFGASQGPSDAELAAEVCLADAGSVADWGALARLIEWAYADPAQKPGTAAWYFLVKGMADYRAGRFGDCLTQLAQAERLAAMGVRGETVRCYFQAMAHHRLGGRTAAAARFAEASRLYVRDALVNDDWTNLALMYLARREAESVLGADAPDPKWWKYAPRSGPVTLPARIEAEDYDEGGEGTGYHDYDGPNCFPGWDYRPGTVDVEQCGDDGGGYNLGGNRPGEWLAYTVAVPQAGAYDLDLRVSSICTGGKLHVELDGRDVTGPVTVPRTGEWQVYQTVSRPGLPLPAGRHVLRVVFDRAGTGGDCVCNLNWLAFRRSGPASGPS